MKCQKLSRKEADQIISSGDLWICYKCIRSILPINACENSKIRNRANLENYSEKSKKFKLQCTACLGYCYHETSVRTCSICHKKVHKKCHKENLGCIACCESLIPGYHVSSYDLFVNRTCPTTASFNPYSRSYTINSIGNSLDQETDPSNPYWNEISEILTNCRYQEQKNVKSSKPDELIVFALNIRSLIKNITNLREELDSYIKYDLLCLNETNCSIDKLPNGINDILLEGFYEPIIQEPVRKTGKGGGLAIYVNKQLCDFEKIECFRSYTDPDDASGEFQLIKIHNCKNTNKTKIIANFYRSPSRSVKGFLALLDNTLRGLDRHSRKHIMFFGDANIDLIKYDSDSSAQDLIDILAKYGFAQTVSKPTRVTDHSTTLIDHVYTNQIENTVSTNILTLDISDHLATVSTFKLTNSSHMNFKQPKHSRRKTNLKESRVMNEASNAIFRELIEGESWEGVLDSNDAEEQYEKFTEIYTNHYNTAYPLKTNRTRREYERENPKPWILPWLEEACARKQKMYHLKITSPSEENCVRYEKLFKFCDKHIDKAKKRYYHKQFEKYHDCSRKQWKIINKLLGREKKSEQIKLKDTDGTILNSDAAVTEKFNGYFSTIAANIKTQISARQTFDPGGFQKYLPNSCSQTIYLKPTDPTEIQSIIVSLKNKATLDTKIEPIKVASSSQNFLTILTHVVNTSFAMGTLNVPKSPKNN